MLLDAVNNKISHFDEFAEFAISLGYKVRNGLSWHITVHVL